MGRHASGWTANNTKDTASVGFLSMKLSSDPQSRFLPQFADMNTVPNFDGQLLIGEPNQGNTRLQPIAMFSVQIKTLPKDYSNRNKRGETSDYKYSCDTAAFYSVIEKITMDPVLLLMVDVCNQKAFWKHLSEESCIESLKRGNQRTCTVYFNEEDAVDDFDSFYEKLLEIANERTDESSRLVLIKNESSDAIRNQLVKAAIELNRLLDNEYRFVKESLYPQVKQFGLALNKNKNASVLKVFKIIEDENGELVRNFELNGPMPGTKKNFFSVLDNNDVMAFFRKTDNLDLDKMIGEFCQSQIERFCNKAYLPAHYLSNEILFEVVYFFLDTLSSRYPSIRDDNTGKACFKEDSIPLAEIEKLWSAMIDADLYFYNEVGTDLGEKNFEGTLIIDPLNSSHKEKNGEYLNRALEQPLGKPRYTLVLKGDFPYDFIESVIEELSNRDIEIVTRPWHKPEGNVAIEEFQKWPHQPQIYIWYTKKTFYGELEKLIRQTQSAYRFAIKDFPKNTSCLYELKGKYVFYLKKTRNPQICILHKPGKKFETSWTYDPIPEEPFKIGYDQSIECYSRLDFRKAPLYSMLEFFLIRQICKQHGIHCVLTIGEHLGKKFE